MGLFIDNLEMKDHVFFENLDLERVFFDNYLVWQKWIRKVGNLVTMTGKEAPSPFTCRTDCANGKNSPQNAFNGVLTNRVYSINKYVDLGGKNGVICELTFGNLYLIHKLEVVPYVYDIGSDGSTTKPQGPRSIVCFGVTENDVEVEIGRLDYPKGCTINTSESATNKTQYDITNTTRAETPFKAIRWRVGDDTYQGRYGMYSCKITEWSSKN